MLAKNQFFRHMHSDDLHFYRHCSGSDPFILAADFKEVAYDGLKLNWAFTDSRYLHYIGF